VNADQSVAVTAAVNAIVDEVKAAAQGVAAPLRSALDEIVTTAQAVSLAFVNGQIDAAQAEADAAKLSNAVASRLLTAGYDAKAARIEVAGKALGIAFKLASAILAAA
jgi:hypothetical protein